MVDMLYSVLLFIILRAVAAESEAKGPIVYTRSGPVRGFRSYLPSLGREVDVYRGIPFARPPIGHLRFRHPLPVVPWAPLIYNATRLPASCPQKPDTEFGEFYGSTVWNSPTQESEDCLYLNVYVPRVPTSTGSQSVSPGETDTSYEANWPGETDTASTTPSSSGSSSSSGGRRRGSNKSEGVTRSGRGLAVMVWIYGGGFYSGTSTLTIYDGKTLASLGEVIVVSIGYRVGALGFLSLGGHSEAPGNAGLFDQAMALDWIRQNADRFGGDPNNITIFGESAGSVSVSLHLLSPISHGKFDRAILQSGVANMPWAVTSQTEAKRRSLELAFDYLRCPRTHDMSAVADCLRRQPATVIVNDQWVTRGILQFPFVPVVDGVFLPAHPDELLQQKEFKRCPILLGSNSNEASFFLIYELAERLRLDRRSMTRAEFLISLETLFEYYPQYRPHHRISSRAMEAIKFQYTNWHETNDTDKNIHSLDMAVSDGNFVCPLNQFAHRYAQSGVDVYTYLFTQRTVHNPWPEWMGVLHADEIFLLFGEPFKLHDNFTDDERDLARQMITYWTNFAKTGNPNHSNEPRDRNTGPTWPVHTPAGREYLELNSRFLASSSESVDGRPGRHRPSTNGALSKAVGRGPRASECAFWREYLPDLFTFSDTDDKMVMHSVSPPAPTTAPVTAPIVTCPPVQKSSSHPLRPTSFALSATAASVATALVTTYYSLR